MKAKLIHLFTVSLVTLVILSPEILVFGVIWQYHLEFKKTNFLIQPDNPYQVSNSQYDYGNNTWLNQKKLEKVPTSNSTNQESLDLLDILKIILLLELSLFSLPLGFGLIFFIYERYLISRNNYYKKQIELLEKAWQHHIEQK
jgi:hypothetical protein